MIQHHKFAIIGCGRIAERHLIQAQLYGTVVAVCDIVKEKADQLAAKANARTYETIEDLLFNEKGLTLVVVCTPNGLHATHSIAALRAGFDVLCEKPMAINSADAQEMAKVAKEAGRKLFVVKQNRYNPPVIAIKNLLNENKLGRITAFQINCFWNRPPSYFKDTWRGTITQDGGILYTQFSHFIDLMVWMLGDVTTVTGMRSNMHHQNMIEFEDNGAAILQMENGAIGSLQYSINAHEKNMEGSITLFGEKGTVKIGGQYLNTIEHFNVEGEDSPQLSKGNEANEYGFYTGSMSNHDKVYENMVKAILNENHDFIKLEEAINVVEIIEQIYKHSPLQ